MVFAQEALGVDFVDVLGAGGSGREPAVFGRDLEAADAGTVAGRLRELAGDGLARQLRGLHGVGGQLLELGLLGRRGGRVDARVVRCAQARGELGVVLTRVFAGDGRDLGG